MLPQARYFVSARAAVTAAFIAYGISAGLWAGAIPAVMRNAGIDSLTLGQRNAPAPVLDARLVLLALIAFGAVQGVLDLFMNAEGSYVESDLKRPIFTRFHAAASLAMALFAIIGSLVMANMGPLWAAAILCLALLMALIFIARRLPGRFSAMARPQPGMPAPRLQPLVILGLAAGLVIAGETAAIMWSAKLLDEQAPRVMAPWFFGWIATLHSTSFAFGLCAVAMAAALGFILVFQMLHRKAAAPVRTPAV